MVTESADDLVRVGPKAERIAVALRERTPTGSASVRGRPPAAVGLPGRVSRMWSQMSAQPAVPAHDPAPVRVADRSGSQSRTRPRTNGRLARCVGESAPKT